MKDDYSNSAASRWSGKLSQEDLAPWIMMDIGFKGILLLIIFLTKLVFVSLGINNKWRDRVSVM
jgi:hypothetical protein